MSVLLSAVVSSAQDSERVCGTDASGAQEALALHRYWSDGLLATADAAASDFDEDEVAVLLDRGELVARRNPFDLDQGSVRFSPNAAGGYDATRLSLPLDPAGTPLGLGSNDVRAVDLAFAFPFFGERHERVYVHSDGSLTFGTPDRSLGRRGLSRVLAGPPRIAAFFADLDPSRGGAVSALALAERAVFVWSAIPGGGQANRNTFQATLHPDGRVDLAWGEMQSREGVVGVSPGGGTEIGRTDLSAPRAEGGRGALLERFSETEQADLVAISRRFLSSHPDVFEQLVVYTTRPLNPVPGTLAFEVNVRNDVEGIGLDVTDGSAEWGSRSVLASVAYMDSIDQYLDVDGFEILAHEVGHRWLARLRFRDASGSTSGALLGRADVHWSFFMDTDASVMEGNDLADRGGGRFETAEIATGYSALDQYVMGLRAADEVPPFFYVESPDNFRPNRPFKLSSSPELGVSFTGTRRDVSIADVVAATGPRRPDSSRASRVLRNAFVLVADDVSPATQERRRAIARIRSRFEGYYEVATEGRGAVDSSLRNER
jgi:hypothetical protein